MLVDSHCHLNFADFSADEIIAVIGNARANGVGAMLSIATDFNELTQVLETTEQFDDVFAAFGVHPEYAAGADLPKLRQKFAEVVDLPKFIGVGETGLDFSYEEAPDLTLQEELFRLHIEVARRAGLPLIIHTREAEDDTLRILSDEMAKGKFAAVLHCFAGTEELARAGLDMGFYISASGIITFGKSADSLRAIMAKVPMDRLLIETDAPFLAPTPNRGKRNEPAFVRYTAAKLAEIKGVSLADIEETTTQNFFNLFTKAKAGQK